MQHPGNRNRVVRSLRRQAVFAAILVCVGFFTSMNVHGQEPVDSNEGSLPVILFDSISYDSYNPDTFLHTSVGIQRGFRSMGFKGNLQIHRFGVTMKPGTNFLSLHFYEYSSKRIRLIAFYVRNGERKKAGYYSQTLEVDLDPEQAPEWMIEQIGRRLIVELNKRFPEDFKIPTESNDES